MNPIRFASCIGLLLLLASKILTASEPPQGALDANNVVWDSPGTDSRDSMPLGNGDIGLNVWVEKDGDLLFYISKTDAWGDSVGSNKGLLKLGRIRVKLTPNPFAGGQAFRQTLVLRDGAVVIQAGQVNLRIWVDANHPLVRVDATAASAFQMQAGFETLRPVADRDVNADTILEGQKDRVVFFYRNRNQQIRQLKNLTFGAILAGDGLVGVDRATLRTARPATNATVLVYPLTAQAATPEQWVAQAEQQVVASGQGDWAAHTAWWRGFWNRSWIAVGGSEDARRVTQGYVLQRFVSACAGRGAYPIKFNGSIFTMDWLKREKVNGVMKETLLSADARDWGGQYWFQNTRPMYWPMLASGDFEMMQPLFRMYANQLPGNAKAVHDFYDHDGAYFAETNPFWGSLPNIRPDAKGGYTLHYFTPILELSAMMLD